MVGLCVGSYAKGIACSLLVVSAVSFVFVFVLYSRGTLPIQPFWWNRPIVAPSSEDYAAYSAFLDDFFSSTQPFRADQSISPDNIVFIVAETSTMKNTSVPILPLQVAALGPEDMGQDFFRQNSRLWYLEPQFRSHLACAVVDKQVLHRAGISGIEELFGPPKKGDASKWLPHSIPAGPFPENPKVSGVLQLSRIGFDHTRTRGLVYYDYICGVLFGQSGWATLRKVHGDWKLDEMASALCTNQPARLQTTVRHPKSY
jgi:hypothetical protein